MNISVVISRPWTRDSSALEFILSRFAVKTFFRSRDLIAHVSVLVSRPEGQGLGLDLEIWRPRPRSRSRDLKKGLGNNTDEYWVGLCAGNNWYEQWAGFPTVSLSLSLSMLSLASIMWVQSHSLLCLVQGGIKRWCASDVALSVCRVHRP